MNPELCHLIPSLNPGGAENLLLGITRKAKSEPMNHTICYFEKSSYLREKFERYGATVKHIKSSVLLPPYVDPITVAHLLRYFRENSFDIITNHVYVTHHLGRICGVLSDSDTVISVHHNTRSNYHPYFRLIEQYTRDLDDATVAVSEAAKSSFNRSPDEDWQVIHNGIDVREFRNCVYRAKNENEGDLDLSNKYPIFLNVGRYSEQKSQIDIICAFESVVDSFKNAHLLLVGQSGDLKEDLHRAAKRRKLQDHISITGRIDNIHRPYALADVFVLSSIHEGFGIVLLEALSAGLPVVATDIPAVNEVLKDEFGTIVPTRSPNRLATAMENIVNNKEENSEARFNYSLEHFDIRETADGYLELYQEFL